MSLNSLWFKGVPSDQKNKHEEAVRNARVILDILSDIIEDKISELQINKESDYSIAHWPYLQADRLGAIKAYTNILKLTKLDNAQ